MAAFRNTTVVWLSSDTEIEYTSRSIESCFLKIDHPTVAFSIVANVTAMQATETDECMSESECVREKVLSEKERESKKVNERMN